MLMILPPFVWYSLLGIAAVLLLGGSFVYVIKSTIENIPQWEEREYTPKQKAWLLVAVVFMFVSLGTVICAFGLTGTPAVAAAVCGSLMLLISSLYIAVIGSPVEIITPAASAGIIGQILLIPGILISCAVALLVGWIFALIAVFRDEPPKARVGGLLTLALAVSAILWGAFHISAAPVAQKPETTQPQQLACPPLESMVDEYLQTKLEGMRKEFGFADVELVVDMRSAEELEPRYQQEDVGKVKLYLSYCLKIPSFTNDLQSRAAARSLTWQDVVLGEMVVQWLDFEDFHVENYTVEGLMYCQGILTEDGQRLTFDISGDEIRGTGTIGRAYNIRPDGSYSYDWLFHCNGAKGNAYYSKQEYQDNAS